MGSPHPGLCSVSACLYERLGGAAAVAAVVDDAVDRHAANPALAPLFCGKDLPQLKALGISLFSARVGGPCDAGATGASTSDAVLSLSPAELQAAVGDMTATLRELDIGMAEVTEVLSLIYGAELPFHQERFKNAGCITFSPADPMVDLPTPRREST